MKKIVYKREIPEIVEQTPDGEQVVIREAYLQTESLVFTDSNRETQIAEALKYAYNGEYEIIEEPDEPKVSYIPTPEASSVAMMRAAFSAQAPSMTADQILQCSGLAPDWTAGKHKTGEVYNADNQTWECLADYDNSEHPDVVPGNSAWFTFNRPYHGRSPETARPWVRPQNGTADMYRVGECIAWTDGYTYRATRDTTYSVEEYAPDWEKC